MYRADFILLQKHKQNLCQKVFENKKQKQTCENLCQLWIQLEQQRQYNE